MSQEFEPKFKISILIPSRGQVSTAFAVALRNLWLPPFTELQVLYNQGCQIDKLRNELVETAKQDWLLFLDDDLLPPANALVELVKQNREIMTGLYFAKQQPYFPQIYKFNEETKLYDSIWEYDKEKEFEVDGCGAGFLLVKKEVFKDIGLPYFSHQTDKQGKRLISEDLYFCRKAKNKGYKIWCDPKIILRHINFTTIGPEFWEISLSQIKIMKEKMKPEEWQTFLNSQRN